MKTLARMVCFFCAGYFLACSPKTPAVMPVNQMKVILHDLMKADEWFVRISLKDTNAQKKNEHIRLYEQVFKIHQVNRDDYFKSYRFYAAHPIQFKVLIDSVDALATRDRLRRLAKTGQGK